MSTVAQDKETAIILPWKKFVLPDPLAPTAKKKEQTDTSDVTNKNNCSTLI